MGIGNPAPVQIAFTSDVTDYVSGVQEATQATQQYDTSLAAVGKTSALTAKAMQAAMPGGGFIKDMGLATKQAAQYERSMSNLKSTAAVTGQNFDKLQKTIRGISKEFPITAGEAKDVVTQINALGITSQKSNKALVDLTKTSIRLAGATGEDSRSLTQSFGMLSKSFGNLDPKRFEKMSDSLTYLSKTTGASATSITEFSRSIAPFAQSAGIGQNALMGISGAFATMGDTGRTAASAMSKMLSDISDSVRDGTSVMDTYAAMIGKTHTEFQALWKSNPAEVFKQLVNSLGGEGGAEAARNLDALGVGGTRAQKAFLELSQSGALDKTMEAALGQANIGATVKGAEASFGGLADSMTKANEAGQALAETMGEPFMEPMAKKVDLATAALNQFTKVASSGPVQAALKAVAWTLSVGGMAKLAVGGVSSLVGAGGAVGVARMGMSGAITNALVGGLGMRLGGGTPETAMFGTRRSAARLQESLIARELAGGKEVAGMTSRGVGGKAAAKLGTGLSGVDLAALTAGMAPIPYEQTVEYQQQEARKERAARQEAAAARAAKERADLAAARVASGQEKALAGKLKGGLRGGALLGMGLAEAAIGELANTKKQLIDAGTTGDFRKRAAMGFSQPVLTMGAAGKAAWQAPDVKGVSRAMGTLTATLGTGSMQLKDGFKSLGSTIARSGVGLMGSVARMFSPLTLAIGAATAGYAIVNKEMQTHKQRQENLAEVSKDSHTALRNYNDILGVQTKMATDFAGKTADAQDAFIASVTDMASATEFASADISAANKQTTATLKFAGSTVDDLANQMLAVTKVPSPQNVQQMQQDAYKAGFAPNVIEKATSQYLNSISKQHEVDMTKLTETQLKNAKVNPLFGGDYNKAMELVYDAAQQQGEAAAELRGAAAGQIEQSQALSEALQAMPAQGRQASESSYAYENLRRDFVKKMAEVYNVKLSGPERKAIADKISEGMTFEQAVKSEAEETGGKKVTAASKEIERVEAEARGAKGSMGMSDWMRGIAKHDAITKQNTDQLDKNQEELAMNTEQYKEARKAGTTEANLGLEMATNKEFQRFFTQAPGSKTAATEALRSLQASGALQSGAAGLGQLKDVRAQGGTPAQQAALDALIQGMEADKQLFADTWTTATKWRTLAEEDAATLAAGRPSEEAGEEAKQRYDDAVQNSKAIKAQQVTWMQDFLRARKQFEMQQSYMQEDFNKSRARAQEDYNTQMGRQQDDYETSRARAARDYHISIARSEKDFQKARARAFRDFNKQMARAAEDAAQSMYNPYQRIQTQATWDATNLTMNIQRQNDALKKQIDTVTKLKKAGLSQQTIDMLGLAKAENAQQASRLLGEAMNDPKLIAQLNQQAKDRIKMSGELLEESPEFRRAQEDFAVSIKDMTDDYSLAMKRAAEDYDKMMADMAKDFAKAVGRAGEDFKKALSRMDSDYKTSMDRAAAAFSVAFEQITDDYETLVEQTGNVIETGTAKWDTVVKDGFEDTFAEIKRQETKMKDYAVEMTLKFGPSVTVSAGQAGGTGVTGGGSSGVSTAPGVFAQGSGSFQRPLSQPSGAPWPAPTPHGAGGVSRNTADAMAWGKQELRDEGVTSLTAARTRAIGIAGTKSQHFVGKALDIGIPNYLTAEGKKLGAAIANYFTMNPKLFGTRSVIWNDQQNTGAGGWRPYRGSPGDSGRHLNHVHVGFMELGGILTRAKLAMLGESGPETVLPLNRAGMNFMVETIRRVITPQELRGSLVGPYASPVTIGTNHNTYDHSTRYTGPITVQASNPEEMEVRMRMRQRRQALTRPSLSRR